MGNTLYRILTWMHNEYTVCEILCKRMWNWMYNEHKTNRCQTLNLFEYKIECLTNVK